MVSRFVPNGNFELFWETGKPVERLQDNRNICNFAFMKKMIPCFLTLLLCISGVAGAQSPQQDRQVKHVYFFAGDSLRGREAGSADAEEKGLRGSNDLVGKPDIRAKDFETSLFGATDTQGIAKRDVPTLYVTTGLKSPYHKPEDDAELIDNPGIFTIGYYFQ
jgi:hypothetical protein